MMLDFMLKTPEIEEAKKIILIQYPGIIKNVNAALETLGGLSQITSKYHKNLPLELRHNPTNPYSSCISSERKDQENISSGTMHLVIKVKRRKKKPEVIKTEIIGLVNSIFSFQSMADFQYLPMKKRPHSDGYEDLLPSLIPTDMAHALNWWQNFDRPTPLFLPPFQFSRFLTPSTKILMREYEYMDKKRSAMIGVGQNMRSERKALTISVNATDEFPQQPRPEAIEEAEHRCKHEEPHRIIKNLFEERPMWTRMAISCKTGLDEGLLKGILHMYAFYIQSGPWGRLWCKFGYDPRTTKESMRYQTSMVTFRQHDRIPERQRLKAGTGDGPGGTNCDVIVGKSSEIIGYEYIKGTLPKVRQMWYSLMDIHLEEVEELLRQDFSEPVNVARDGWIPAEAIEAVRIAIKNDVKSTSEEIEMKVNSTHSGDFDEDF
ncbi:unnamed protein product [Caenorhabditis bovis]|uniref:Transcription factor IIIC subunit 5 HTH domain-containing protein n=1 Tax=Caenorhabditis bovis TaxID=2654633 RepID=A0A8S1EQH2_9PELO|nr:unnamed protein product [Caenorhabditis bovis]